jgi:RNA polymerase sigma-70 factor (ECF subfamily)
MNPARPLFGGKSTQGAFSISEVAAPNVAGSAEVERNSRIVDQLYAAIRALPPAKRALVVLYLDDFTYREIAEVVGISESNVGVSLNRIKKELAATIQEDCND